MNYALDALWWRLTDPNVRDLAAILTAPPLWHSGCELPLRELLGETGFRYLLALDSNPAPLQQHLAAEAPFAHRLGFYAESLLAFWLQHAPHAQLFARNLPVKNEQNGQTLGALDFVCALNGKIYHLELTCKYYGATSGRPSEMAGLNPHDRLIDKAGKLTQQLAWSRHAAGVAALQQAGIAADKMHAASLVRGIGFSAAGQAASIAPLNACGWHGLYIGDWAQYPHSDGLQTRCYLLPPMHILSPARVPPAYAEEIGSLVQIRFGQVALLQKRPDGYWHETARLMKTSGFEAV